MPLASLQLAILPTASGVESLTSAAYRCCVLLLASKMLSADDLILPMRTTVISGPELSDVDTAGTNERRLAYWKRTRALIPLSSSPRQEPERARTSRHGAAALAALCQTLPGRAAFSSSAPPELARPPSSTLYASARAAAQS
ncbi:hypothetical protein V8E36_004443 [Tilletia maclaganii]